MQRAGVHLQSTTNLATLAYKMLQHGEGGGLSKLVLGLGQPAVDHCAIKSATDIEAAQKVLQDHPSYFYDQKTKSRPLPREPPSPQLLEGCNIPWVVLENPKHFPFF